MGKRNGRTLRQRRRRLKDSRRFRTSEIESPENHLHDCHFVEFMKWLHKNEFQQVVNMRLHKFEETARGLMTLQNIQAGMTIISIPEKLLITPDYVLGTNFGVFIKSLGKDISDIEILTLFLISEKLKGFSSQWYPYLSTLPKQYDTPILLKDDFWNMLPPSMCHSFLQKINEVKASFSKIQKLISNTSNIKFLEKLQFDLYIWAFFTVNTRVVYKPCEHKNCGNDSCDFDIALAPYLDLLNHSWEAKVQACFNTRNRCYEIVTLKSYKKYSEVFINYGDYGNRKLLAEYGFIQENNTNDMIPILIDDIKFALKESHGKTILPETLSFLGENLFSKMGITLDGMTWNLEMALKIICDESKDRWKEIILGMSTASTCPKYKQLVNELINLKLKEYQAVNKLREAENQSPSPTDICPFYWKSICKLLSRECYILSKVLTPRT